VEQSYPSPAFADMLVAELSREREVATQAAASAAEEAEAALATCEKQLDRLLDMRLSEQINEQEYVSKKHALVNQKAELRGKIEAFDSNQRNRLDRPFASYWRLNMGQNCSLKESPTKNAIFSKNRFEPEN
jgi:hypothetical protein